MKIYRYRLSIDTIIKKVDEVTLVGDNFLVDTMNDYPEVICSIKDISSGELCYTNQWEVGWLCFDREQDESDIRCDLTRIAKSKLHQTRKEIAVLMAKASSLEEEIEMIGGCEFEDDDC